MMPRIVCKKHILPFTTTCYRGRKFKTQRLGSIKSLSTKAKSWSVHNNKKREYTFTSTEEMEQVIGNIPCNPDLLDLMVTDDEIEQNAVAILSALTDTID